MEANLVFHKEQKHERFTVLNVKNKECQQKFLDYTTKTDIFTKWFKHSGQGIIVNFANWKLKFQKALYACFRKVRVTDYKPNNSKFDILMNEEKKKLVKQKNTSSRKEERIDEIDDNISK